MAEENTTEELTITREQMLKLLNEDLAREDLLILEITKQIDHLTGKREVANKPDETSKVPVELLRAVLENERKMTEHYHKRMRQAEAMGEFALSETLHVIIAQEHDVDLSAVLESKAQLS